MKLPYVIFSDGRCESCSAVAASESERADHVFKCPSLKGVANPVDSDKIAQQQEAKKIKDLLLTLARRVDALIQ